MTPILVIAASAILAGVGFWLLWTRKKEKIYFFRCPSCSQKVRYEAMQAGRCGTCPCCRKSVILPADPETAQTAPSRTPAYRVRRMRTRAWTR